MMNKVIPWLKDNQTYILGGLATVGLVGTVVSAIKATPKAEKLIFEMTYQEDYDLTPTEKVLTVLPVYLPTILWGTATVTCILGMTTLSVKKQLSLQSAYAMLDQSFKDYRNKAEDIYGEGTDINIVKGMMSDQFTEDDVERRPLDEAEQDEVIFFDRYAGLTFSSTLSKVYQAMYYINRKISIVGFATLNDFYKKLNLEPIDGGDEVGWSDCMNYDMYWQQWVDFDVTKGVITDRGVQKDCFILSTRMPPDENYDRY